MDADRPEKRTMRKLWLQKIKESAQDHSAGSVPLYLTLSGASGHDIELMVRRGIVKRNEVGGIANEDEGKIVAVESSLNAVLELQKKFPGLKILDYPFQNLVRSANPIRWPEGQDEVYCRAHIVNLDLNQPLLPENTAGQISFPILQWIQKLAQLHAIVPQLDWLLFLTLHGEITWEQEVDRTVQDFLRENFQLQAEFANACRNLFGDQLFNRILSSDEIDFSELANEDQQKVLMAFVPKKIARLVVDQGWLMITSRNIRYGGGGHAPMVTWIMSFVRDTRASGTPSAVYSDCLKSVLAKSGYIEEDGHLS